MPSKFSLSTQIPQKLFSLVQDALAHAAAGYFATQSGVAQYMRPCAKKCRCFGFGVGKLVAQGFLLALQAVQHRGDNPLNERPQDCVVERNHRDTNKKRSLSGELRVASSMVSVRISLPESSPARKIFARPVAVRYLRLLHMTAG